MLTLGDIEQGEMRMFARVYYVLYVTSTMWIVLNLMITIITEAFSTSRAELSGKSNKYEALQYISHRIRDILGIGGTTNPKGNKPL